MEQAGVQLVAQGANVYISDMASATKATAGFVSETESGSGRVSGAGQVMIGALRQIGTVAVDALGQALKATAGFLKDSVGLAGDFQQGMLEFQSVAGADVDTKGLEQFHDLFLQLGKDLPVSTSDVQQAAIEMVKGGIDPAIVAAGGLRQNIQFAAAAMKGDLAGAAEISAKILGGWMDANSSAAEQAAFLTHSTDLLTKAANASTLDVDKLALGLFNAQGIAKVAGVSFDDLTTALAELSPRFASGAEAGTSLKNMIARLQPTTKKAIAEMEDLGLITEEGSNKFYDAQGNFVGMSKASDLLQNAMKGLTKQQQASVLQTIFGNDAMGAAAGLAELGADGYDAMAAKMEKANGVAAAAALVQQSFNTKMDNARGSLETFQLIIGERLLPVLGDLLDNYITPGINTITDWTTALFKADDPLVALSNDIDSILPGFNEFGGFVEKLSSALAAGDWSGAFGTITQGLGDLGDTFGPPLIDALDTGVQMAWDWIQEQAPAWLDQLGVWGDQLADFAQPYIPPMLAALGDAADQAWAWVQAQAPGWIDQLGAWGEQLGDWVAPYIPQALDALEDLVSDAWAWVQGQAPAWGEELKAWGSEMVAWIGPAIPPALAELGKLGQGLLTWVGDQAAPLLTKLGDWATSFTAWIPGATVKFLGEWPKMFDTFLNWIGNQAGPLLAKLGTWAVQFTSWIIPMIPGFVLALGGIAAATLVFLGETAGVLYNKIANTWVPAIVDWIAKEAIPKLGTALLDIGKTLADWSVKTRDWLGQQMIKAGTSLVEGIIKGVKDEAGALYQALIDMGRNAFDQFMRGIRGGSPALEFVPGGESVVQGIMLGMQNMLPGLYGVVDGMGSALKDQFKKVTEDTAKQIDDAVDNIQDQVKQAQKALTSLTISSFTSGADINRTVADNLGKFKENVKPGDEQSVSSALQKAEQQARAMQDPAQGAKFFKEQSDRIFELAALRKDAAEQQQAIFDDGQKQQETAAKMDAQRAALAIATTNDERNAIMEKIKALGLEADAQLQARHAAQDNFNTIQQQIAYISAAQGDEVKAADLERATAANPFTELANHIRDIMNTTITAGGKSASMPPVLDEALRGLNNYINQLTSPAASGQQIASRAQYNNTVYNSSYNLGVNTNQSPAAVQQSFAVMSAMSP